MKPGAWHWCAGLALSLTAHLAVFAGPAEKWVAAEQTDGGPEAVWGLTEVALSEAVEPLETPRPVEPVESEKPVAAVKREHRPLTARAVAEQTPVAAPEEVEPARDDQPVEPRLEERQIAPAAKEETVAPNREHKEVKPEAEPAQEAKPVEKRKKVKPKPRKQAAPSGPVGRDAGRTRSRRTNTAGRASFSNYAGLVAAHLRRYKHYPSSAGGATGVVMVAFSLSRGGSLQGVRLVRSSGNGALDQAAIAMVRRANPFPSIPADLNRSSATFSVPIRFAR